MPLSTYRAAATGSANEVATCTAQGTDCAMSMAALLLHQYRSCPGAAGQRWTTVYATIVANNATGWRCKAADLQLPLCTMSSSLLQLGMHGESSSN